MSEGTISSAEQVVDQCRRLELLTDGWMGHGSIAPSASDIESVKRGLLSSMPDGMEPPSITATGNGELFLEWRVGNWIVSAETLAGKIEIHALNLISKQVEEIDIPQSSPECWGTVIYFIELFLTHP